MIRHFLVLSALLCVWLSSDCLPAQESVVQGIVVDKLGSRVADVDLSPYWRANGSPLRPDGTEYELSDPQQAREFWGNIGQMEPWQSPTKTAEDGSFTLDTLGKKHILAIDQKRQKGGVYLLRANDRPQQVKIPLGPLTTVKARVQIADTNRKPTWSHVFVNLEQHPDFPLANNRVISCGSGTQQFEFRLPKGTYRLEVYAHADDASEDASFGLFPQPKLKIDGNGGTIDLGVLTLQKDEHDLTDLKSKAKESGRWRDYTEHYGEPAPSWHAIDARGIGVATNIQDLRGKWVLLEFWGLSCAPCLSKQIPELMQFYDRHSDDRDRFEVIGVCIDLTGEINTIDSLDAALKPIVEKVWQGKEIPFPIVLDNTFQSWERFGIPGFGTTILVDPQGNIVTGGIQELENVLQAETNQK